MALALHKGFGREKDENRADLWPPLMSHSSYQNDGKILTSHPWGKNDSGTNGVFFKTSY